MTVNKYYEQALSEYKFQRDRPLVENNLSNLLNDYHPDFYNNNVILTDGVNKGIHCNKTLASILQSQSIVNSNVFKQASEIETDILVIGGGGAGCTAALTAADSGCHVTLATKLKIGDSNTIMAEGGIQAAVNEDDSQQQHYLDTIQSQADVIQKSLVSKMTSAAPETINWLIQQGVQFDIDNEGNLATKRAGGTSASRVVSFKDYTGLEMMRVLKENIRSSSINVLNNFPAVELLSDADGSCSGAILLTTDNTYICVRAKSVILATGGIGRLHLNGFPTSNHFGATGDGLVLAYRLGARLRDIDSFQYHPTGFSYPQKLSGVLITEGIRSAGAQLLNARGERFIDELRSRNEVSAAILRECSEGRGVMLGSDYKGVWLDTPLLEKMTPGIFKQQFPKFLELALKSGINPLNEPVLTYPTLHYQNGGVVIDEFGLSSVSGLYCVGELSGGIHGRNRLMGNALLDIIYFSRQAATHAGQRANNSPLKEATIKHLRQANSERIVKNNTSNEVCSPVLYPEYANYVLKN